jgi:hypothetical protein
MAEWDEGDGGRGAERAAERAAEIDRMDSLMRARAEQQDELLGTIFNRQMRAMRATADDATRHMRVRCVAEIAGMLAASVPRAGLYDYQGVAREAWEIFLAVEALHEGMTMALEDKDEKA